MKKPRPTSHIDAMTEGAVSKDKNGFSATSVEGIATSLPDVPDLNVAFGFWRINIGPSWLRTLNSCVSHIYLPGREYLESSPVSMKESSTAGKGGHHVDVCAWEEFLWFLALVLK